MGYRKGVSISKLRTMTQTSGRNLVSSSSKEYEGKTSSKTVVQTQMEPESLQQKATQTYEDLRPFGHQKRLESNISKQHRKASAKKVHHSVSFIATSLGMDCGICKQIAKEVEEQTGNIIKEKVTSEENRLEQVILDHIL